LRWSCFGGFACGGFACRWFALGGVLQTTDSTPAFSPNSTQMLGNYHSFLSLFVVLVWLFAENGNT
jgi:hypothetical protein